MVGMLLRLVGTLFAGIFLEEMTKWVWLGIVMPVTCLSGGVNIFILVIYSFVSDNSTPRLSYNVNDYCQALVQVRAPALSSTVKKKEG